MTPKEYRRFDPMGNKHTYGREYMRVSSLDCHFCGKRGWWAHHVKSVGSGGRDAFNLVPVCLEHHTAIEKKGQIYFSEKSGVDLEAIALVYGLQNPNLDEGGEKDE
jgi:hypothetical protein